jgi:translation initiation factor IF-3
MRYEAQQREREAKKKQRTITWKEVRIAPKINEHDLDTKIKTALRLLGHGDKLKLVVRFRGRELAHPDRGRTLLLQMAERLKDVAAIERPPLLEGRQMIMVMDPRRGQAAGPAPAARPAAAPASPPSTPAGPAAAAVAAAPVARPAATARPAAAAAPRPVASPPARPAPAAPQARLAAPPASSRPAARPAAVRTQRPA